jgi:hypothetical protein
MTTPAPVLPARARRVVARLSARATLSMVAAVLVARGAQDVDLTEDGRLYVDREPVAFLRGGEVVLCSVLDGIDHTTEVLAEEPHRPTVSRAKISAMAFAIELQLKVRETQRARFAAWKAARHAA